MADKKRDLEKVSLGIGIMFGIYWIYSIFIQNNLNVQPMLKKMIGLISLYCVGLFVFVMIIKKSPEQKWKKER